MTTFIPTPEIITTDATLQDLSREKILFPVEMVPTSELLGGIITPSDSAYSIVATINKKRHLLQTCSGQYNLKENKDIFPVIEKMLDDAGIKYTSKFSHIGYSKFYAEYVFTERFTSVGTEEDIIFPMLNVTSSYNGKLPMSLGFGLHRQVCSNGLTMPFPSRHNFNQTVKHTDKLEIVFGAWIESIKRFIDEFTKKREENKFLTNLDIMAGREVKNIKARIEDVKKAVKDFPVRTIDLAIEIATAETDRLGYKHGNDWLVYNGMNEALFSNRSTKHPEFKAEIDAKLFDWILSGRKAPRPKMKAVTA
jgi:hypothetical protein